MAAGSPGLAAAPALADAAQIRDRAKDIARELGWELEL
jgi:hypothetical protein